jgi:unspecific monooxygenase
VVAYERDRIGWLATNRDRYGDVVRLGPAAVAVHDVGLAHEVLAATNDVYTVDATFRAGAGARRQLEDYLTEWMRVRRDVWRCLAEQVTHLHLHRFSADLDRELRAGAGQETDVLAAVRGILGRAIVDFCVGGGTGADDRAALYTSADALFRTALHSLVNGEPRVPWLPRPAARAAVAANERLLGRLDDLVRQRMAGPAPSEPRDLLDALLDGHAAGQERRPVVSVLRTIMFASHGVPGTAMAWIALVLAERPDVAAAVRAEAATMRLDDPAPAQTLPFTSAVVREVLRMYPPQWLITRTALRDTTVGPYRVRAGTEVLVCPYLIHRDPRWWDDPQTFRPERWLGADRPHARHAYLPFGSGPRICPGSQLAMVHLTAMTALLARDYTLHLPPLSTVAAGSAGLLAPATLPGRWSATAPVGA